MNEREQYVERAMECMRRAVFDALDQKRRMGQYAVIYEEGKVLHIGPEEIERRIAPLREKYGAGSTPWPSAEPAAGSEVRESGEEFEEQEP